MNKQDNPIQISVAYNFDTGAGDVHKPGCRDIRRDTQKYGDYDGDWVETVSTLKDVCDLFWGPDRGSYYRECSLDPETAWETYHQENVHFCPCASDIHKQILANSPCGHESESRLAGSK